MEPIVIARAPLSITLGEYELGSLDRSRRCRQLVIRAAINYYAYTIVSSGPGDGVHIIWAGYPSLPGQLQKEGVVSKGEFALPEAISRQFNMRDGLMVFLAPQVPWGGGLGLSGSLAVSMIKALAFCSGVDLDPEEVAELACQITSELLELPAATADPYAAAYGGLNSIEFGSKRVSVEPLHLSTVTQQLLEKSLMLFRANGRHPSTPPSSARKLRAPIRETPDDYTVQRSNERAERLRTALEQGDLPGLGELLHRSWIDECRRPGRDSDALVDKCYWTAREHGALGGRGETATAQGTLALCCPEENQPGVTEALTALGMHRWPLRLEPGGVEILEAMPRTWSRMASTPSALWSLVS